MRALDYGVELADGSELPALMAHRATRYGEQKGEQVTACSMEARRWRIATATQRRRGKGNLGVRLLRTTSTRSLAVDDEDDGGGRLGQGGAGSGGRWPRACTTAATVASGGLLPDDCERRRR